MKTKEEIEVAKEAVLREMKITHNEDTICVLSGMLSSLQWILENGGGDALQLLVNGTKIESSVERN